MLKNYQKLWSQTMGDPTICVAVIDGSADLGHPCFEGADVSQVSLYGNGDEGLATNHGTQVASIIFGQHYSKVKGIAPSVRGVIIPIFSEKPDGTGVVPATQLDLARAINKAIEQGANVINISGGELDETGEPEGLLASALKQCEDSNILVVAAAGNNGCKCLHVPAASPSVLAVGATDSSGEPMAFSNWGDAYKMNGILAPGFQITSANVKGGVAQSSGTSFATPIVSGLAALMLSLQYSRGQDIDPLAVRKALLHSAIPCPENSKMECVRFLSGNLNIDGALKQLFGEAKIAPSGAHDMPTSSFQSPVVQSKNQPILNNKKNNLTMINLNETIQNEVQQESAQVEPSQIDLSSLNEINPSETSGLTTQDFEPLNDEPATLVETPSSENPPVEMAQVQKTAMVAPSEVQASDVEASDCGCGGKKKKERKGGCGCSGGAKKKQIVYVLGTLGYDFGTETKRDGFIQLTGGNVHDPTFMLSHLQANPHESTDIIWTLNQELTPIYAIYPIGPYAEHTYSVLHDFLDHQLNSGADRVAIPGIIGGKMTLLSGQSVPVIVPNVRAMASWTTGVLVTALGLTPGTPQHDHFTNFLERVYYELRNFGVTSTDRAINFSATNAFQPNSAFHSAIDQGMELSDITAEKSPIGRPGTDTYDVKLTFFDPKDRNATARKVFRWSVDVSDIIPVSVGTVRSWSVY